MDVFVAVVLCVAAFLIINICIFLIMLMPSKKHLDKTEKFRGVMLAHRGLHNDKIAENTLSAFSAAVDAGYGIELDVRLSSDGEMVIFHDDTLERITDMTGPVLNYTAAELAKANVSGTGEGIPTFRDVLALVDGRVPILVEIKEQPGSTAVTDLTAEILRDYKGEFLVESFDPLAVQHFHRIMPDVPCGILCRNYMKVKERRSFKNFMAQNLITNYLSRPDFVAYMYEDRKNFALRILRIISPRTPIVAWTLHSQEEENIARKWGYDAFIFEGYMPEKNERKD